MVDILIKENKFLCLMESKKGGIAYFSTFLPRKCGLATFTEDLSQATNEYISSKIIALDTNGHKYNYPDQVKYRIHDQCIEDYLKVARQVNDDSQIKLVSIQHEFKIFGSDHGENLLFFLGAIKKPVITTFHTVLPAPSNHRKHVVQLIAERSQQIVVMTPTAVKILMYDYGIDADKIKIIPHGIHDMPYQKSTFIKEEYGLQDRTILSSFGLLRPGRARNSSGKGCEYVLDALPEIIKKIPKALYLIIGQTHPKYLKIEGERYREFLQQKVINLGLENHVKFLNEFVSLPTLFKLLQASDLYICSSSNKNQICSGSLIYAMGCGRAVVSTRFPYAKDIVSSERGDLVEFDDSKSIALAVIKILSNSNLKEAMEMNAYAFTRPMVWSNVALAYLDVINGLDALQVPVRGHDETNTRFK